MPGSRGLGCGWAGANGVARSDGNGPRWLEEMVLGQQGRLGRLGQGGEAEILAQCRFRGPAQRALATTGLVTALKESRVALEWHRGLRKAQERAPSRSPGEQQEQQAASASTRLSHGSNMDMLCSALLLHCSNIGMRCCALLLHCSTCACLVARAATGNLVPRRAGHGAGRYPTRATRPGDSFGAGRYPTRATCTCLVVPSRADTRLAHRHAARRPVRVGLGRPLLSASNTSA